MTPIRVSKITIQGVKGILKSVELSLGKASKPCSLAIFAPNACGKSGIADALEYFFDEEGKVEHLGVLANSEKGGKTALPHIHAKKSGITSGIAIGFSGGHFSAPRKVMREVRTGTKEAFPPDIKEIVEAARASRILRQHDLRSFIVEYDPSTKYKVLSRWVGLDRLTAVRDQLNKAQTDFNKKNKRQAIEERLVDISIKTGKAVTTFHEQGIVNWINDALLAGINVTMKLASLSSTKELFSELDRLQDEEDQRIGIKTFQDFIKSVPLRSDDVGNAVSVAEFSFEEKLASLAVALSELEQAKSKTSNVRLKKLWENGEELLGDLKLECCPLCETEWSATRHKSRVELLNVVRNGLSALKAVTAAEEKLAHAIRAAIKAVQNDKALLLAMAVSARTAGLSINAEIEKKLANCLDSLLDTLDADKMKSVAEVLDGVLWRSASKGAREELFGAVLKAQHEISKKGNGPVDAKRFHNAKVTISAIIESKMRHDQLVEEQKEFEWAGDALAKIAGTIRDAIKDQMSQVLAILREDMTAIYEKITQRKPVPTIFIDVPDEKSASLYLRVSFYDVETPVPPGGYLSESYINALGISIFLSAVRRFNSLFPFIVLDDIISSYDVEHRNHIVDILAEDFKDFQILLTTHDHIFYRQLRNRLQDREWQFKQIKSWKIDSGPVLHNDAIDDEEIEKLFEDRTAYQAAGNRVRERMEEWLDKMCDQSEFCVYNPHRSGMGDFSRTLYDYWIPFLERLKSFGPAVQSWLEGQACVERLKTHPLINYYSHYQSNPYEWGSMADVEYIWNNFKEFKTLFICQKCGKKLFYKSGEDKKPYCKKCGEWP